jgi:nucleoside-diphosphate-sugar epimerase
MRLLVIGGTGFIGPHLVRQLAEMGHEVAVFHRGRKGTSLPAEHIHGERSELPAIRPKADVVIDLILSSAVRGRATMDAFRGIARRVVAASSIDVYRACGILHGSEEGPVQPVPLTEDSAYAAKCRHIRLNRLK